MSTICGIYNLNGNSISPLVSTAMLNRLSLTGLDYPDSWSSGPVFTGCQIQRATPESLAEKLPYYDSKSNMTITADAILYNRDELLAKLDIHHQHGKEITDSYLILEAYQKWGRESPQHLLGDFAFGIWDGNSGEMFAAVDHTGNRTFYYYLSAQVFAFSTLIEPLLATGIIKREYSESWIGDFLLIPSVLHQLDSELTLYKDIYLLPAGHTLTVGKQDTKKQNYWRAERQNKLKLNSDQEYAEALIDVLHKSINARLRSIKPVGIMLSGGLDSTSVASLAAHILKKDGRNLRAFTAIPVKGYRDFLPNNRMADETPLVETLRRHIPEIDVTYCASEGKHALSNPSRLLSILEQPYKVVENLFWIDDILDHAHRQGVGVLLTGGVGNTTVSYGIYDHVIVSLMRSGKWHSLIKEVKFKHRLKSTSWQHTIIYLFKALLPYELAKTWYKLRNPEWEKPLGLSPINPQLARRMYNRARYKMLKFDPLNIKIHDAVTYRLNMLSPAHLSHMGIINTKMSLAHNIALRDPCLDKRVIEFCLSVPAEQYIRQGRERCLLRQAMQDLLPDEIRLNYTVRGQQSADFVQRLAPDEAIIKQELMKIGELDLENKYLDIDRIHKAALTIDLHNEKTFYNYDLRMLLRSIIFSRYIRDNNY